MPAQSQFAIVDDDSSFRVALLSLVRSLGHDATGFDSAEAFLASGLADRVDCIISDIQMPGITGIELKRQLVASGITTPVVLITGRTEDRFRPEAEAIGAACFMRKPFDSQELIDCVGRVLGE